MSAPGLLLFLDFGGGEIIIILLVILIVLGPDKIPEFVKKASRVMRYIKNATDDIKTEINKEVDAVQEPVKSAYNSVTAFSKNAQEAMNTTLDNIENDMSVEKPATEDKAKKTEKAKKVSIADIEKEEANKGDEETGAKKEN